MPDLVERFLSYVAINTQSNALSGEHPSSPGQHLLAKLLESELKALGLTNVRRDKKAYVFADVPPSPGRENEPVLGLIAHLDTSASAAGSNIKPSIINYDGNPIVLSDSGLTLDEKKFPELGRLRNQTLIVTDGHTLLGADDKAGIAEIMTALEKIFTENISHRALRIAFTPDEEIGEDTMFFDVEKFGADYAYTIDGGAAGEIEFQNFNAAEATFNITGFSVHPGSAKNLMKNAQKIAVEIDSMLPQDEVPEKTEHFQGFYHLTHTSVNVSAAQTNYLIRDHQKNNFEQRKENLRRIAGVINEKYGAGTVKLTIKDQYRNMEEIIRNHPELIALGEKAVRAAGMEPLFVPVRGGTAGAYLSFRGLPCPNLGTGGYNFHGECEFAVLDEMQRTVKVIVYLAENSK